MNPIKIIEKMMSNYEFELMKLRHKFDLINENDIHSAVNLASRITNLQQIVNSLERLKKEIKGKNSHVL